MALSLVWLVTGTTSGIGAALVEGIVARGDKVIATGRRAEERLAGLKSDNVAILDLDVVSPLATIQAQIAKALAIFGRIDVLINNAGMNRPSSIEDASAAHVSTLFEVNLFGAMRVTQAILPHFRAQGGGKLGFIGAGLAWCAYPFITHYSMAKAALGIFVEGLQKECTPFNIHSTIFELGGFESRLAQPREGGDDGGAGSEFGGLPCSEPYLPLFTDVMDKFVADILPRIPGDLKKLPDAIIDVLVGEGRAAGRPLPVRVILGPDALDCARQKCSESLQLIEQWEDVTLSVMREGKRETSPYLLKMVSILDKN